MIQPTCGCSQSAIKWPLADPQRWRHEWKAIMSDFEILIDYYKLSNIIRCFKLDIVQFKLSGIFIWWLITVIAFVMYSIGVFINGWASLVFLLAGFPLILAWSIYVARNPEIGTFRNGIDNYLNSKLNSSEWDLLCNYMATQYISENSKASWKSGYAIVWLSFVLWQTISYFSGQNSFLNYSVTSFMIQSAIAIIAFLYFVDSLYLRRRTRIHMAISDIKKYEKKTQQEASNNRMNRIVSLSGHSR